MPERILTVIVLFIVALLPNVHNAASLPQRRATVINAEFFLSTNDDVMDALIAYAEVLCTQDRVVDRSPQAWLDAAQICNDTSEGGNDGAWHQYALQASAEITQLCAGKHQMYELCKYF